MADDLKIPEELAQTLREAPFEKVNELWLELEKAYGVPAQRWLGTHDRFYLLVRLLNRVDVIHPWLYARCREVEGARDGYLDLWAREHYKDLADATPMLTANRGWTTHGELSVGDSVYSDAGIPVKVLAVSPAYTDSECYQITFSDGSNLVAGAGHLWRLRDKARLRIPGIESRRIAWSPRIVSTKDLSKEFGGDVGVCAPLQMPTKKLPIHPYVLGCWLGDDPSAVGRFTCSFQDIEILEHLADCGITLTEQRSGTGLNSILREWGLINNKHIPQIYMEASQTQRMELLRGLMDTAGHCNTRGTATFCQVSLRLSRDVYTLATTLGLRPRLRHYANDGNGYYQVSFQAHADWNPFKLTRKSARAIKPSEHRNCRRVARVDRIPSVPTRCIQVEGGMYVAGCDLIPTHNSTLITYAGIIQEILMDPEITVGIFSHTKGIAKDFLRQIKQEFELNTLLKKVFADVLYENPTEESPRWSVDYGLVVKRKSNPKEASVESHGLVEGMPTGKHFNLRVYDDVVTRDSVSTPEQIAKTTEMWELSDNLGAANGRVWHIGTRYSYADTYDAIIKRGAVKVRLYPATVDGTIEGTPVLMTPEVWAHKVKVQGEATISCQMLQNPLAGQQRMFNIEDIQTYEVRPETLNVYVLVDPARSKKTDSDNTAITVVGVDVAMNKYLLDGFNHKMDLQERWLRTASMWAKWRRMAGVQGVWVGYEAYGAQADLDYFTEQMKVEKIRFEIAELMWPREGGGSKIDRVQRIGPDLATHKVFLPYETNDKALTSSQRWCASSGYEHRISRPIRKKASSGEIYDLSEHLRVQLHYFPHGGKKDLVDAFSRIYDMEPRPPYTGEARYYEPECT